MLSKRQSKVSMICNGVSSVIKYFAMTHAAGCCRTDSPDVSGHAVDAWVVVGHSLPHAIYVQR